MQNITTTGKLAFHTLGDTGQRTHGGAAQEAIADHMAQESLAANGPRFLYHLGDVIYFNGERTRYEEQFYEPYKNYASPIFAIPGNHDGAVFSGDSPLQGFMENFCSDQPMNHSLAGESPRTTMTQPNCYWTLLTPLGRIIGLYSNVPGALDRQTPRQLNWLKSELRAAKAQHEKCVIVAVHHPPYSRDTAHGGYDVIGDALDDAFHDSGRVPNLVLCGHVHNYQRFERDMNAFQPGRKLQYVTAGAGGFADFNSLHLVDTQTPLPPGVTAKSHEDSLPGYLVVTLSATELLGQYFVVQRPPNHRTAASVKKDEFRITL